MMNRREALQLLATGAALHLAPIKALAAMREARAILSQQTSTTPGTLNAHQDATVKAMAEMILPRTDTPGAADVGATEFIDLMLTEWCEPAERTLFQNGLSDVDARSRELFSQEFVGCNPAQQVAILNELGDQMTEHFERARNEALSEWAPEGNRSFYAMFRWLTLTAYYTSEQGATQELHYEVIPERHEECVAVTREHVTSEHATSDQGGPQPR